VFAAGGEHGSKGPNQPARPVLRAGGDKLAKPFFAQPAETQRVHEAGEHRNSGVGDQRLAGETDRQGLENSGRLLHRKGAPSLGK
jgi:hypothetical protein